MNPTTAAAPGHKIVSRSEWLRSRTEFLAKEKELTHLSDELARQRSELPWTKIDKEYVFIGPRGKMSLADLFDGQTQLATYHFMFGPDWDEGCPGCSYVMDHMNGAIEHLQARDVKLVAVSRAPARKVGGVQEADGLAISLGVLRRVRLQSRLRRAIHTGGDVARGANVYNFGTIPPHGEENPGLSCFYKDPSGAIFHTFSAYGRGLEAMLGNICGSRPSTQRARRSKPSRADGLGAAITTSTSRIRKAPDHAATKIAGFTPSCCQGRVPHNRAASRHRWELAGSVLSLAIWALMPKCPVCLAPM